jgi:hypothetical protein
LKLYMSLVVELELDIVTFIWTTMSSSVSVT